MHPDATLSMCIYFANFDGISITELVGAFLPLFTPNFSLNWAFEKDLSD
jgi:hypothetical protein